MAIFRCRQNLRDAYSLFISDSYWSCWDCDEPKKVKKVTELLLLWSIETTSSVFDYLIQQASSELNYMPYCLR